jgi:bacteriocin biosynthesis cyclodehydratase domain-containing protein
MQQETFSAARIHLLSVGGFGRAVADHLKAIHQDVVTTEVIANEIPVPQTWPAARVIALAAWRPVPSICELLDRIARQGNMVFIPLILNSMLLRLGPVIQAGTGCCWACWVRRRRQHDPWPNEQAKLELSYASDPELGAKGYLEPMAMLGSAMLVRTIASLASNEGISGQVVQVELATRRIASSSVMGIHDCPKCGMGRPCTTRTYETLQGELAYLWSDSLGA